MTADQKAKVEELDEDLSLDAKIKQIKSISGEEELDVDVKNSFGNLTLLDSSTNRSYGNSLFVTKRRIINERVQRVYSFLIQPNISSIRCFRRTR